MPLFFLIAIGAGAFTMGATTVDVASDGRLHGSNSSPTAQVQTTDQKSTFQAYAYSSQTDCLNAASSQGLPTSACQKS
jgi:hypothetical protein